MYTYIHILINSQLAAGWATVKLARQLLHFTSSRSARLRRSTMTYDYPCPCLSLPIPLYLCFYMYINLTIITCFPY